MTSATATTFHLKLLECCATTLPRPHFTTISGAGHAHFSTPFISLKSNKLPFKITPSVAQTSDWAQQDEDEKEDASLTWDADADADAEEDNDGGVETFIDPPEEAKLFVGNLPYDVDSEKLAQLFNQAGIVEISEVIYNRQTDQSRGFGFVTMCTVEEAEKAIEMFNRYDINGRLLTVNKAAPRGSQPERAPRTNASSSFRMYVGNLPWRVDNSRLEQVFSEHGKVVDARVVIDQLTGRSRGFGFVTMASETEVNDAIAALDGQELDGRAIRVNIAEERPRRVF